MLVARFDWHPTERVLLVSRTCSKARTSGASAAASKRVGTGSTPSGSSLRFAARDSRLPSVPDRLACRRARNASGGGWMDGGEQFNEQSEQAGR